MKTIITTLITLSTIFCSAQSDTALTFSSVVNVDSASKAQLFEQARLWFTDYFKSAKSVLQVSDKESGQLTGKAILESNYKYKALGAVYKGESSVNTTIKVLVKDGKYKYEIYDLYETNVFGRLTTSNECPKKFPMQRQSKTDLMWQDAKSNITAKINLMLASLNTYMNNKTANDF